ncbi:UBX domain-containing protein 4 isoform X2 [Epargyreus clarus]|uniref:UBX domain-containing protein 4 isoform X1 n=1 Tax=Epargyreus clarus TaxID=520877 RepID=UPI003C2B36DA
MHWYGGNMAEAVTLSKQRNAIFVVFIEGENDLSTELAATIENQVVVKKLSDEANFLAVKLKSGSENYTHFAKIYQFVPVPSLFFIGRNGTPLEVVCAGVEPQNLAERIDRILDEHYKEKRVQPSTSGQNIRTQTVNLLQTEATTIPPATNQLPTTAKPETAKAVETAKTETAKPVEIQKPVEVPRPVETAKVVETAKAVEIEKPVETKVTKTPEPLQPEPSEPPPKVAKTEHVEVTKSGKEYTVVCDGDVCVRRPSSPNEPGPSQKSDSPVTPSTPPESSSSASMEDKLEHAKEVLEARRREKADKEKELEKQKEKERRATGQGVAELKRWQAEQEMKQIQEERKREKLENDLARQRILQQIAQDRAERRARDQPTPSPAPLAPQPEHAATSGDAVPRARVQFKLPDGSAHTAHFDAGAPLAEVRRYVADNLQLSASAFALWTAFPRCELTDTDATLRELQLAPSAALLVLPRRSQPAVASPSAFSTFITLITQLFTTMIMDPAYTAYTWLRARFAPGRRPPAPPAPRTPPAPPAPPGPTPPGGAGGALRRRGNVHRLTGDRGNDDDNNTWNGNSTQQM